MTKDQFIAKKVAELKKIIYGDDPGLETYGEEEKLIKFCEKFLADLKEIANKNETHNQQ